MEFEKTLKKIKDYGFEGEIYYSVSKSKSVKVNEKKIEEQRENIDEGIGIRVIKHGRVGFAFTTGNKNEDIEKTLKYAMEIAEVCESDGANILPTKDECSLYQKIDKQKQWFEPGIDNLIKNAFLCEEIALSLDSRIKSFRDIESSFTHFYSHILNTAEVDISGEGYCSILHITAVGEEKGDRQLGFEVEYSIKEELPDAEKVAKKLVSKIVKKFYPIELKPGKYNLVLSPFITAELISSFITALTGDNIYKRKSIFVDKLDKNIGSRVLNIVDDPFDYNSISLFNFDGEGVPVRKKYIIEKGVLKTFLHNKYSSIKLGDRLTGNGVRAGYRAIPGIAPIHLNIEKGENNFESLIKNVNDGLYITELMGLHTIDTISGEFSIGASGNIISSGEIKKAVHKMTIAGNIRDILEQIVAVCDNTEYFVSGVCAPSILLEGVSISG
ncbi:MAG: TldD/PmbA family protein [Candidatus Hydrogenedentota bacterium]